MNTKTILLIVGLVIGGLLGWLTAPKTDIVKVGPLSVEVQSDNSAGGTVTATGNDGQIKVQVGDQGPLSDRNTRTIIFAIIGGLVGAGAAFAMGRRKI